MGNDNLAYAENFLLYRADRQVTLAEAVSAAQERQVARLMERYNSDAERAARQAGGGTFALTPEDAFWSMPRTPTDFGYQLGTGAGWNHFRARVKSIKRQGGKAKVEFFADDGERIVAYNCSKKAQFVGFDNNGRAEYDKVCNHKRVAAKYPVKPITLDASETAGMRTGDDATFVRTKEGPICFVYAMDKNGENAAVRGLRLGKTDLPNFWKR